MFQSQKTTIGQTPYAPKEDTTIHQPTSMYEASKEFYRMERQKTLVAARYVRNSDPSKKDSEVLKAQADALSEYAKKKGYECPDQLLYVDAISALKYPYWERSGLMKVWDDAERGEFDIVLCTEFLRIARKSSEQYAVMEYLKRFHVELESITEKFEDTAEGRLLFALQGFLGELEAEKIHIRTSRGRQHRAEKALTGQGGRCYGYTFADTTEYVKGRYELNLKVIAVVAGEEWTEVRVVIFCYDSCLKGMSCRQIALALTRMGIPTQQGREAWNRRTIRQLLSNNNYTGDGYNGRYTKEEGVHNYPVKGTIKLPDGIYPQIIDPDTFERVQIQLTVNAEMSARNNRHPQDTTMRGMVYCGICKRRMQVKHFNNIRSDRTIPDKPVYRCWTNQGIEDTLHHHHVAIATHTIDDGAWKFAVPYIRDPQLIRDHVLAMKKQIVQRNHSQDLAEDINQINKSIANLYKLAEVADPNDKDGMEALQARLTTHQHDKREKEKLLHGVANSEEKQKKILAALDRFEAWCASQRPYLDDPSYQITQQDKISALLILGVKATVWPPTPEYEDRSQFQLLPPDVARFCDVALPRPRQG